MTEERQDITDSFYAGNDKTIRVTIRDGEGNLKDLSGSEITYVIFDRISEVVVLRKSSFNGDSEIKVTGTGLCEIYLLAPDTTYLYGTFRHQLNVVDSYGKESTVLTGKVEIHKAPGKRYRIVSTPAYLQGTA